MRYLAIDLGSSFIKGAVLDLAARSFGHVRRVPCPEPLPNLPARQFEIDPRAVVAATRALIGELLAEAPDCAGLVMSSQMHSLVLADARGEPLSNAVTWRDQRALDPHPSEAGSVFDALVRRVPEDERQALGNELRPGLPVCTLFWMAERGALSAGAIPAALPDFVLGQLCGAPLACEPTIAAAQGTLDLRAGDWHWPLLERLGLAGLRWPPVRDGRQPVGEYHAAGRRLVCFPAIGDQQCALLGAGLRPGELSLNISTGSQVSLLRDEITTGNYQVRPFFGGRWLNTITHIPAGRALDALVRLLCELAEAQGAPVPDPWAYIAQAVAATGDTDLEIDLAFFASALGDRGALRNIHEGNLTAGHLFRAAFERMAASYAECAQRLAPAHDWRTLVFSGGLAQNLPILREIILRRMGAEYRVCDTPEDALRGLLGLALVCNGQNNA
jgi:xylulokinase